MQRSAYDRGGTFAVTHPVTRVDSRGSALNVARWVAVTWPEPDLDPFAVALQRVPAAALRVERRAKSASVIVVLNTAAVVALTVVVAGAAVHWATAAWHVTSRVSVDRHLVDALVIDAFNLGDR